MLVVAACMHGSTMMAHYMQPKHDSEVTLMLGSARDNVSG